MQVPESPRSRRSQRDYSLPFKRAVVGEVGRGELRYQQAQRRYGMQGRSTVLPWCRRYATPVVTSQAAGLTSPGTAPAVEQPPEQRMKQLQRQLRAQKKPYQTPLKDSADLKLLLRTRRQVVEQHHGIPLPKKSFRRPFPGWRAKKP